MLRYRPEAKFRLVGLLRQRPEPRPLRSGKSDQRALQIIAAPLFQELGGALVLHPFGDGNEIEPLAQLNKGTHESAIVVRAQHILDESSVDLDHVDAELAKVAERGEARAKIVDGDAAAEVFSARDETTRIIDVADHRAFGDLYDEAFGDARMRAQKRFQPGPPIRVGGRTGRSVHAPLQ